MQDMISKTMTKSPNQIIRDQDAEIVILKSLLIEARDVLKDSCGILETNYEFHCSETRMINSINNISKFIKDNSIDDLEVKKQLDILKEILTASLGE